MEFDSQSGPSKILLVTGDEVLALQVKELLRQAVITVAPAVDAGLVMISVNPFHAVLFEVPQANAVALFQITYLTTKAARLPVLVIGPDGDKNFLAETI